ncbi:MULTISPECIES: DUF1187 family protein [unclassified Gilliamella]|uniref:DUF1187 family protein n=1 Tax=unclassified Gilliamella TaxID=2685620 RepID=UPI00226AF7E7|nr:MULTISPECIES: DUF1187 family protein [unclassified Gilliamella]MCX8602678.1 DUF1187 family protein [Gilliamella sp. B3722]MCX8607161.1 DUF1187 family protein [Gilliamella sp. B3771]MCX8611912.1 DUF1187 family protein [Gilliamella sp. B3891]MCX8614366.1 DUF1187 family protein [Gilliamella sp. B3773]MCX8615908.1 DUF1187 family protein [Gilliamella sp. B3770]
MAYKITAEIKKGWQSWGSIVLQRDSKITEKTLIKTLSTVKTPLGKSNVDVQVRNFECERV